MALEFSVYRSPEEADRARALVLLRQFGWNATSFQVLEPDFRYFFEGPDACVAYVRTRYAWVAAGAPIAPLERQAEVAERFARAAQAQGLRAVFAFTEPRFVQQSAFAALQLGEQPVCNPQTWLDTLARSRSLREQLRRARAKGVRVRRLSLEELKDQASPMRRAIVQLVERWQSSRSMAPMGFLVAVHLFGFLEQRRFLVAEAPSGLVGLLVMVPVYARSGVLVEDLLRAPDAPNGTTESLIDHALREAAADGCEYLTLGLAPLSGEVEPWLRAARKLARGLYDFSGLRRFKAKFMPREWTPIYLSYPRRQSVYLSIYDTLDAFAHGNLVRFGVRTLLRDPTLVVRTLTPLLAGGLPNQSVPAVLRRPTAKILDVSVAKPAFRADDRLKCEQREP